jgi:thiol-disulfide isomerase/thioredoxin
VTPTGVHFVLPPDHLDVASFVARARAEAASEHRRVLVYVGADWCPPCLAFHSAVEAHRLDRAFPDLTLLEFDYDLDAAHLRVAGYVSRIVPYFTVPGTDGRATGARIEGAIREAESVDEIVPRLHALLGDSASAQN